MGDVKPLYQNDPPRGNPGISDAAWENMKGDWAEWNRDALAYPHVSRGNIVVSYQEWRVTRIAMWLAIAAAVIQAARWLLS